MEIKELAIMKVYQCRSDNANKLDTQSKPVLKVVESISFPTNNVNKGTATEHVKTEPNGRIQLANEH